MTQARQQRSRATKSTAPAKPTAGASLIAEFSKDDDPFSFTFQVQQTAHVADHLEKLTALLNGDRQSWLEVKIGAKTVEVIVTDVLRQHRQTAAQLEKSLAALRLQRAAIDAGGDLDDDVLDDDEDG